MRAAAKIGAEAREAAELKAARANPIPNHMSSPSPNPEP